MKAENKKVVMEKLERIQLRVQEARESLALQTDLNSKIYYSKNRDEALSSMRSVLDLACDLGYTDVYQDHNQMIKDKFENGGTENGE